MEKVAVFGSVFKFNEDDYVFLAFSPADEILYTAKILDSDNTETLLRKYRAAEKNCSPQTSSPYYYFVVLTTADFEGRAVHFGKTENNEATISTLYAELNEDDKRKLLEDIMVSGTSPKLKQLLKVTTE